MAIVDFNLRFFWNWDCGGLVRPICDALSSPGRVGVAADKYHMNVNLIAIACSPMVMQNVLRSDFRPGGISTRRSRTEIKVRYSSWMRRKTAALHWVYT